MRKFTLGVSMLVVLLLPKIAWAGSLEGGMIKVWNYAESFVTNHLWPAETWMWIFTIGILWILLLSKFFRKTVAPWITYITPPFTTLLIIWGLSFLPIPFLGKAVTWWKGIMERKIQPEKGEESLIVRELTLGVLGCVIVAGGAGGKVLADKPLWLWGFFVPAGVIGIIMMILFIAEKVGGEKAKAWVKNAPKGSVLGLWQLIRFGKKKLSKGEQPPADQPPVTPPAETNQPAIQDQSNWVNCPTCGCQNPPNYAICGNCEAKPAPATQVTTQQDAATDSHTPPTLEEALDLEEY